MASGWWETTYANLDAGLPVDLTVTTQLVAPRGYPKIPVIATGAGLFLGGTPCTNLGDVIYYASDDYTQPLESPSIMRWDGRVNTKLLDVPTTATPGEAGIRTAQAILSIITDNNDCLFFSTWDEGTTSTTFGGRIFKHEISLGTTTMLGPTLFATGGRLPYALKVQGSSLYVGVNNQDPAVNVPLYIIDTETGEVTYAQDNSSTASYQVTSIIHTAFTESGPSNTVSTTNATILDADAYNTISWPAPTSITGAPSSAPTLAEGALSGIFGGNATVWFRYSYSTATSQTSLAEITDPSPWSVGKWILNNNKSVDVTVNHSIDPNVKWIILHWKNTAFVNQEGVLGSGVTQAHVVANDTSVANNSSGGSQTFTVRETLTGTLTNPFPTTNVSVSKPVSYKVYRTVGHTSQGQISTGGPALTFVDTGIAATPASAPAPNSVTAPTASILKHNVLKLPGGTGVVVPYAGYIYAGQYQVAGTFPNVYRISSGGEATISNTIAPGGTARGYNGFTAGVAFGTSLYMGYWNDDTTDMALIRKFDGTSWTTVKSITGANARPFVAFHVHGNKCYAVAGGDAKDAFLYVTSDGSTWTDITSLLPTGEEGVPFIGTANVLGGF